MNWQAALRIATAIAALLVLSGCATHVVPPTGIAESAKVFILDHGRHTSLVVSTADDEMVRYAYGDWRYYAERRTGPGQAIAALLWNTPSALGRRRLPGPATAAAVRQQVPLEIEALYEIEVERRRIDALRRELDAIFDAGDEPRETPETALYFVPHPRAYNLFHNSNTAIANWLEALGCEVRGWRIFANWRIDQATSGERQ